MVPVREHLDFDCRVLAQFLGPLAGGDKHAHAAVGRVGLGTEGVHPVGKHRFEAGKAFGRGFHHSLVGIHGNDLLLGNLDSDRKHVPLLKGPVVLEGIGVLLVAAQGHRVALLPGDAVFGGDVFGRLDHGVFGRRVETEVVHNPVFGFHLSPRPLGIGPDGMRAVGAAVDGKNEGMGIQAGFHTGRGLEDAGG